MLCSSDVGNVQCIVTPCLRAGHRRLIRRHDRLRHAGAFHPVPGGLRHQTARLDASLWRYWRRCGAASHARRTAAHESRLVSKWGSSSCFLIPNDRWLGSVEEALESLIAGE